MRPPWLSGYVPSMSSVVTWCTTGLADCQVRFSGVYDRALRSAMGSLAERQLLSISIRQPTDSFRPQFGQSATRPTPAVRLILDPSRKPTWRRK